MKCARLATRFLTTAILIGSLVGLAFGQQVRLVGQQPTGDPTSQLSAIQTQLGSGDPAQVKNAVSSLQHLDPTLDISGGEVLRLADVLAKLGEFDVADGLMVRVMCNRPWDVPSMQSKRAQLALQAGNPERALALAKGFYNVCAMADTHVAIDLLCVCLDATDQAAGKPKVRSGQFRLEQALGAVNAEEPSGGQHSILSDIRVDDHALKPAINGLLIQVHGWNNKNTFLQWRLALLLLASDQPRDARRYLERAYGLTTSTNDLDRTLEEVARAIRACDGSVGRANAFLASLRHPQ